MLDSQQGGEFGDESEITLDKQAERERDYDELGYKRSSYSDDPKEREMQYAKNWSMCQTPLPRGDRRLLREIALLILYHKEMRYEINRYLGMGLLELSRGKSVKEAFLMRGAGRPFDHEINRRDMYIGIEIAELMRTGVTLEKAAAKVGEAHNLSEDTAKRAYKRRAKLFKGMDLEEFRRILAEYERMPDIRITGEFRITNS